MLAPLGARRVGSAVHASGARLAISKDRRVTHCTIRPLEPGDLEIAGRIIYRAFSRSFRRYGYPEPVTDSRSGAALAAAALASDPSGGLILEGPAGQALGVSFTQLSPEAAFIGPVAIDPDVQGRGHGRRLLNEILLSVGDRSARLLQDSFNPISYRLYARAGFDVRETLALLVTGPGGPYASPFHRPFIHETAASGETGVGARESEVRSPAAANAAPSLRDADLSAGAGDDTVASTPASSARSDLTLIGALDTAAIGVDRSVLIERLAARARGVILDPPDGAYGFACAFHGTGVWVIGPGWANDCHTLVSIIVGLADRCVHPHDAVAVFAPTSHSELIRSLLGIGFRVSHLVNLMVRGDYRPPVGACLPVLPIDTSLVE